MNKKAVTLLSGGLDSTLATRLVLEQGIEVYGLNFLTIFCTCTSKGCRHEARKAAEKLGIPLTVINITEEYMEVVKNPKYGRGRNMNPCIDCRIFTFRKAREFMEEIEASFIITGEVLGERPMSQRREAILLIEKESGLEGLIVRPLSAKLFEPSLPERLGIVDRSRFLDIQGRRRTIQMELAKDFHIYDYPCPAGGCLLTDRDFSNRLKDLLQYIPDYTMSDLHLLKIGRQFRFSEYAKFYLGRNESENDKLLSFAGDGDIIFEAIDSAGPLGLLRGRLKDNEIDLASCILARYCDKKGGPIKISYKIFSEGIAQSIEVLPAQDSLIASFRI